MVKNLVSLDDVRELNDYTDDLLSGCRSAESTLTFNGLGVQSDTPAEWLRAHMLHRKLEI